MSNPKKPASIGKNFLYNTAYQILAVIVPLITTPFAARVFGAEGVGVNSYVNSMANIVSLFAALGITVYGQREIAQNRDDRKAISKLFWEIELLRIVTTTVCVAAWIVLSYVESQYTPYFLVSSFTVLAVAFDISWFFSGLEEFRFVVLRNTAIKLLGVVLLFACVRTQNDLLLYMGLIAATGLVGNISMWSYLPKFLEKVDRKSLNVGRHFKETLVYFIPTIAASVYTMVDKVMLRFLTEGTLQNGFYEETTKIVRTAQVVLLSINTVMTPRMSYLFKQGKLEEMKQRLERSMSFILLLAYPFAAGIAGISANFVPWFFGEGFDAVVPLLRVYSPLLIIVGISSCLSSQYLTPSGQRGRSSKGIIAGAVSNVILNLLFIPKLGAVGATVASVFAEMVIVFVYFYMSRDYISISVLFRQSWKRVLAAGIMLAAVLALELTGMHGAMLTVLQIGCGAAVYGVLLLILRDRFVLDAITKVLKK